jgi:hypothetical protein
MKENEQYRTGNQKEKQGLVPFKISPNRVVHPIPPCLNIPAGGPPGKDITLQAKGR